MNFSGFHQKRQDVLETKLHTCIFAECTSGRKVLEHLRGSVTLFRISFRKTKNVMTHPRYRRFLVVRLDGRAERQFAPANSRLHRRELSRSFRYRVLRRSHALFRSVCSGFRAVDRRHRRPGRETSPSGGGVHAISRRAGSCAYTAGDNNRPGETAGSRMRLRKMQFRNASRGEAARGRLYARFKPF